MSQPPSPPPSEGKVEGWVNIVKGLNLSNVLIIFLLVLIGIPTYVIWKALGDDELLDRFLSQYEEVQYGNIGCILRHVQQRGGPDQWGVSSGFAFQGRDRWFVSVILPSQPTDEEIESYCESLKLISDKMLEGRTAGHRGVPPGGEPSSDDQVHE